MSITKINNIPIFKKNAATIISILLFGFPFFIQIVLTDFYGLIFFGQNNWSYLLILELFSLEMDFQSSSVITFLYLIFSLLAFYIYFEKVKRDILTNSFSVISLLVFYLVQFFITHQVIYGIVLQFNFLDIDANNFLGIIVFGFYSSLLCILFGMFLDFIQNFYVIPKIKLY